MKRIFLIGYMCSGKTTLGKLFARDEKLEFIDLDEYIEKREGKSITEIFTDKGESGFREIERTALHEAGEKEDCVISCGGGTPCFFDNMEFMNSCGETILLETSEDILLNRLLKYGAQRPLVAGKNREEVLGIMRKQLAERSKYYHLAQKRLNTDWLGV